MDYQKYQTDTTADIAELIKRKGCQPILFIGSGSLKEKLSEATGFDMRASDNKFHVFISPTRRYSQTGIDLLRSFKKGDDLPDLSDPSVTGIH